MFGDPVQWDSEAVWLVKFSSCQVAWLVLTGDGGFTFDDIRGAMVEEVDHFCFVERQHSFVVAGEDVAVEFPAISFQSLAISEKVGVVRQMERRGLEHKVPGVAGALFFGP